MFSWEPGGGGAKLSRPCPGKYLLALFFFVLYPGLVLENLLHAPFLFAFQSNTWISETGFLYYPSVFLEILKGEGGVPSYPGLVLENLLHALFLFAFQSNTWISETGFLYYPSAFLEI